ncbi:hypothetical protein CANMA_002176 [Candida margitis]|uniref:uncharacterized protein n=1 Tax=Candida margitis TaxID=1775924 RepID=UPI002226EEE1|nr:uncharacterized protein CANMA_002176 [Candida margitis]KAI5968740.1 hypothetical protein CANMA_002176 [Candida margitis]
MSLQFIKPKPVSLHSSPSRPTSLYVTPPLELPDDECNDDHKLEQQSNSTLTPLSSLKSNTTFKPDHHQQIQEQHVTPAIPSLTISTPPITPKEDDLSFFKPPPKMASSGNNLQPDNGSSGSSKATSEPNSPSSSTSKKILSSPARFVKRLSMRLRSNSEVDLKSATKPSTKTTDTNSVAPPSPDSSKFNLSSSCLDTGSTTPEEARSLYSGKSIRVKVPRRPTKRSPMSSLKNETKSYTVSESGSPRKKDSLDRTPVDSPILQLSHSSPASPKSGSDVNHNAPYKPPSAHFSEQIDFADFEDETFRFYDSSRDSMISLGPKLDVHNGVATKHSSIGGESDIFRTPPPYREPVSSGANPLDDILATDKTQSKQGQPLPTRHNISLIQSRKSQASYSPVESNPFLRLNIFLEDSQSTPPPPATSTSDHPDFIAIKLRKDKLQNINELINVIIFKIMNKKPNIKVNDINLSIFFKDSQLKPISLREPVKKSSHTEHKKEVVSLDNGGLLLDYVQMKRKLYIRAQF